jgi:hypothetical protein
MKNRIIVIVLLLILFIALYAINSGSRKTFRWVPTYDRNDQQPLGGYVVDCLLEKSWPELYTHSLQSIQLQIREGKLKDQHLLAVADHISFDEEEIGDVLEYIGKGRKILIAAHSFDSELEDAIGFTIKESKWTSAYFFLDPNVGMSIPSRKVRLCAPSFPTKQYSFPQLLCRNSFDSIPDNARIIAMNDSSRAIAFACPVGNGECIVSCTPLLFTNYSMLSYGHEFVWGILSYLQGAPLMRTEYYELGNRESGSPFRYLLSEPALRWALYLTLATLLILLVFTARRKQRIIPVVKDPENHLLKFVRSIAALYLKKSNNPDILQKKYILFAEQLQKTCGVDIINKRHDRALLEQIVQKTGSSPDDIRFLFNGLELIYSDFPLTDRTLMELVILMDKIIRKQSN